MSLPVQVEPDVPQQTDEPLCDGAQLRSLLQAVGCFALADTGWLRVTGEDRVRWLNGMVTNSIQALEPGQGCFNFLLNAHGRIQGTATAFAEPDRLLVETDRSQIPVLTALLDRFIIMDDVELTDVSEDWSGIGLAGARAADVLAQLHLTPPPASGLSRHMLPWQGGMVALIEAHSPLVPRFELWSDPATAVRLLQALTENGAQLCSSDTIQALRVLEGSPRFGTDIRDRELPQETGQTRALHFSKGCYLGQEIVERIRSRGNVHRAFSGFRLEGELPAPGTPLHADGKAVGELTSVVTIASETLALGYIRREALASTILYPGGRAVPASLPFTDPALRI